MNKNNKMKLGLYTLTFLAMNMSIAIAEDVAVTNVFVAGEAALASEVNENFTDLANAINTNASIAGPTGPQGDQGLVGAKGDMGVPGLPGLTGAAGANGAAGATGPIGLTGAAGANGAAGTDGLAGAKGDTGAAGTNGIDGNDGAVGATGAAGTNGTDGIDGAIGATGATGINGTDGIDGAIGATGAAGTNGIDGVDGAIGATGAAGANGTDGADGAIGATGAAGTNGTDGVDGAIGATGAAGTNGTDGVDGAIGATGAVGTNGTDGVDGAVGATGASGTDGNDGATGLACWDLNGNGVTDAAEDINEDTFFTAADCTGLAGQPDPDVEAMVLVSKDAICALYGESILPEPAMCIDACVDNGGVMVEGGCWVLAPLNTSGNEVCGYSAGYAGPYYSIGGGASADGCDTGSCAITTGVNSTIVAESVVEALGASPFLSFGDCATNYDDGTVTRGTSLSCWNNVDRWSRSLIQNIVRCTSYE